ncbi:MAG: type II toxin-antitoxin system RelE/ParE family toxin [Sterolibacterium sp.]
MADAVYVLHCFQKKTRQTSQQDIKLARITGWAGKQHRHHPTERISTRSGRPIGPYYGYPRVPKTQAKGTDAADFATAAVTGRWTGMSGLACLSRRRVREPGRLACRRQGNPSGRERMRRRPCPWPAARWRNRLSSYITAES